MLNNTANSQSSIKSMPQFAIGVERLGELLCPLRLKLYRRLPMEVTESFQEIVRNP